MSYVYGMLGSTLLFLGMAADSRANQLVTEMNDAGYQHCFSSSVWHPHAAMRPWRD